MLVRKKVLIPKEKWNQAGKKKNRRKRRAYRKRGRFKSVLGLRALLDRPLAPGPTLTLLSFPAAISPGVPG